MSNKFVLILNDGETYSDLQGCQLAILAEGFDENHPLESSEIVAHFEEYSIWTNIHGQHFTVEQLFFADSNYENDEWLWPKSLDDGVMVWCEECGAPCDEDGSCALDGNGFQGGDLDMHIMETWGAVKRVHPLTPKRKAWKLVSNS